MYSYSTEQIKSRYCTAADADWYINSLTCLQPYLQKRLGHYLVRDK